MEQLIDLFYTRARFRDRVIEIKQLTDLILKELENETVDMGLLADYILEMSGHISVLSRWLKKMRLEQIEKQKENKG